MKRNIALIGPMASGKSTIGKCLSRQLHRPFYDTDDVITERCQKSVSEIFASEGEAYFRTQETKVITELSQQSDIILATGGGAIQSQENRARLVQHCWVVYLKVSLTAQLKRTEGDVTRPLLQVPNKPEKLQELQKLREPLYLSIANYIIEVSELCPAEICNQIIQQRENR